MAKKSTKKKLSVVAVKFSEDNVSGLYIDGELVYSNNDYDENGTLAFESYLAGAEWAGAELGSLKWVYVEVDDVEADGFPWSDTSMLPEKWPDGKWSKHTT